MLLYFIRVSTMCCRTKTLHCLWTFLIVLSMRSPALAFPGFEAEEVAGSTKLSKYELEFLKTVNEGLGFYKGLPFVGYVTTGNFNNTVLKSPSSWVIEFYQSWCGYCLRYSTHFKRFAKDIYGWRPVVKVAAVDCNSNSDLCRRFGVIHVPSVRYLPPKFNYGETKVTVLDQRKGKEQRKTSTQLRAEVVNELMNRSDLPMLQLYTGSLGELWDSLPSDRTWAVAVTSCSDIPTLGQELVLDYWNTKLVSIVPVPCTGSKLVGDLYLPTNDFTSLYILNRDQITATDQLLNVKPIVREDALRDMKTYFNHFGVTVPAPFDPNSIPELNITKPQLIEYAKTHSQGIIPFPHSGIVYQVDVEAAIDHSIRHELGQAQKIEGEAYQALVKYLELVKNYFPAIKNGKLMFKCLYDTIVNEGKTTGLKVLNTYKSCVDTHKPVYLDPNNGFLGCRGTLKMFRGYPCSMWMMFHTLQAEAYKNQDPNPKVVLDAMAGYIKHFFACQDCADHFLGMAKTMPERFDNVGQAVLWLGNVHNKANERLEGDQTEDPLNPKVQFPPKDVCEECHNSDGSFNEPETLKFLVKMYTNVDQHTWDELKPNDQPEAAKLSQSEFIVGEEDEFTSVTSTNLWTAPSLTFTLAGSLAGLALALFILICLKFYKGSLSRPTDRR